MKAIRIDSHGGEEVLRTVELPDPIPGPGEVLVDVSHVGLNHLDIWVRKGVDGHTFPLPLIPGSDVVGVRTDTGQTVALHPGVGCGECAHCAASRHDLCRRYHIRGESMDGGMCERVAVPVSHLLPATLPPPEAASLPLSLLTAWHMLRGRASVEPGMTVLIQAGASGVGSLAIQIAKLHGASVAVTASTETKRRRCLALGADAAWPYEQTAAEGRAFTAKAGFDIVLDHVGEATFPDSLRALARGGSLVSCGATSGPALDFDMRLVFFKQLSILGSTMGSMDEMRTAWDAVLSGQIQPVVDSVLPMSQIGAAHRRIEARDVVGKMVLAQDLAAPC